MQYCFQNDVLQYARFLGSDASVVNDAAATAKIDAAITIATEMTKADLSTRFTLSEVEAGGQIDLLPTIVRQYCAIIAAKNLVKTSIGLGNTTKDLLKALEEIYLDYKKYIAGGSIYDVNGVLLTTINGPSVDQYEQPQNLQQEVTWKSFKFQSPTLDPCGW